MSELILMALSVFSQQPVVDLSTPIAVDPNAKIGKLDNGLVYYNGVTVVLKPANVKNDEMLISAYSPGGNSLVPEHYMRVVLMPEKK